MGWIVGGLILAAAVFLIWKHYNQTWICGYCNKKFKQGFGYPPIEAMGHDFDAICIPCHKLAFEDYGGNDDTVSKV